MSMKSVSGVVALICLVQAGAFQVAAQEKSTPGATAMLVEPKTSGDIEALRDAIGSADGSVRSVAARAAGFLARPDMAEVLLEALAREPDANVAAQQVRAVLNIKGLEKLPQARAAATRLGAPVLLTIAEWLARNQPSLFATSMADLVRELGENRSDVFALIVAMSMRQTPTAATEVGAAYATAGPPAHAWREFLRRLGPALDAALLTRGLTAPGAAMREATVWFIVASGDPDAAAPAWLKAVLTAMPGMPVANDTEWTTFGHELLARRSRKGKVAEGSEIIRLSGADHLDDLRALASVSQVTPAERAAVDAFLPNPAGTSRRPPKEPSRPPVLAQPKSHLATRTFSSITSGFMESLMAAVGCTPPADSTAFGAARMLYLPDGRARGIALDSTTLPDQCTKFLRILAVLSVPEPDEPVLEAEPQWLFISMDKGVIKCADQNPGWWRTRGAERVGGGTIKVPRKIKNLAPVYPESMQSQRISGVVIAEAIISATGCVIDARILRTVAVPLDLAALQSIVGWQFEPTELNGKPIPVVMTVTVNFTLR